ncbi:hypothetical protein [Sulfurimonas hydrogeniphila]|uniref:hypothetical protein n=1 Tax=Sulfurimonas hydrogeniphila TaxID=2509341 RepID=UPI0012600200|nr:hypothetical protein [Sulfurimonas hydrogeniphila]
MVDFSVFNELSLPFVDDTGVEDSFISFFKCISLLKQKNLNNIRMDKDFKNFEIIQGIYFPQFFGQIEHKELKQRVRSFVTNGIVIIESPLVDNEDDENSLLDRHYIYNGDDPFIGGLACCEMWNSITVSFCSDNKWKSTFIDINKGTENIPVRHISLPPHMHAHEDFFVQIESEQRQRIDQNNFWDKREAFFPEKIIFCEEVKKQIETMDTAIFRQAVGVLRDIDSGKKQITDYNHSPESQSVKNNANLRKFRLFTIDGEKVYFDNHLKNLSNGYRIYFLEKEGKIYIGYIGKHLSL